MNNEKLGATLRAALLALGEDRKLVVRKYATPDETETRFGVWTDDPFDSAAMKAAAIELSIALLDVEQEPT